MSCPSRAQEIQRYFFTYFTVLPKLLEHRFTSQSFTKIILKRPIQNL